MKTVKPIGKIVLIKLVNNDITPGGIIVPETAKNEFSNIVLAIGDEVTKVKPGDEVLCMPSSGLRIDLPNLEPDTILVKEESILGVLCQEA